jgi:hypothetical protein
MHQDTTPKKAAMWKPWKAEAVPRYSQSQNDTQV